VVCIGVSIMFLIVLILILFVHIVLNVHTVIYIFLYKDSLPVSASEPRCSIISVHFYLY